MNDDDPIASKSKRHRPRYSYLTRRQTTAYRLRTLDGKYKGLRNQLSAYRLQQNMTQAQLARLSGVSLRTIAGIESYRSDPKVSSALKLARVLNAPLDRLFKLQ